MLLVIAKRLAAAIPALIGVSIVSFILLNALPGDPLAGLLAPDATAADRAALARSLGLDAPPPVAYVNWLERVLHGDFGRSFSRGRPVAEIIGPAFRNTLLLATAAAVVGLTIGITLGTVAALQAGKWTDRLVATLAMTGISVPSYWLAVLLVVVFATQLQWFPSAGKQQESGDILGLLWHLVLPAIAASSATIGLTARTTRASLVDTFGEDFVLTLRAKGLSNRQILRHVVKNAAPAIMTVAGLQIGYLLGGSVLVETIFSWPGLGQTIFQAISSRDQRVIQAAVLVIAVTFVIVNLTVDLLQTIVNPRLRRAG